MGACSIPLGGSGDLTSCQVAPGPLCTVRAAASAEADARLLFDGETPYQTTRLMIIHNATATKHPIRMRVSQAPRLRSGSSGGSNRSLLLILKTPRGARLIDKESNAPTGEWGRRRNWSGLLTDKS